MARALVAVCALLLAAGCASRGSVHELYDHLNGLRAEVTELRHSEELTASEVARTLVELRALDARNAELQATLRQQAADAARLTARLDTADKEAREAKTVATPEPTAVGRTRPSATAVVAARPPAAIAPPARASAAAVAPARPAAAAVPPATTVTPLARRTGGFDVEAGRAYEAAVANFRANEHGQAVLDFLDFIATYPRHPLAASAHYWIGEAYYMQHDYRNAVDEFRRVIEMAPASRSAADALLRIGLAYTNLGENARAQQVWQRLVREYPVSEAAGKARALLRGPAERRP